MLPRQHILLALLPNNITARLKTTKNPSQKAEILHCIGAHSVSLRPPTFLDHNALLQKTYPTCCQQLFYFFNKSTGSFKIHPDASLSEEVFKCPLSLSACLSLYVELCVCSQSSVGSCFIARFDSNVIRVNCSYTLFNSLGWTGTPASAGQSHPGVFWQRQNSEKWQLLSLCKWTCKMLYYTFTF